MNLRPPRFVNLRADVVYNQDFPDPLLVTYARLAGLAWRDKLRQGNLPDLTEAELLNTIGRQRSSLMGHLAMLKKNGLIEWHSSRGVFQIRILSDGDTTRIQNFGFVNDDVDDDKPNNKLEYHQHHHPGIQNFGLASNLEALAEFGVDQVSEEARQIAQRTGISTDIIRAWGQYLAPQCTRTELPGLLLHRLQHTSQMPKPENRGGPRLRNKAQASERQVEMPLMDAPELPEDIRQGLEKLQWADTRTEVVSAYQKNPAFVSAWLNFALNATRVYRSRAGLFRKGIRSGEMPPYQPPPREFSDADTSDLRLLTHKDDDICDPTIDPKIRRGWDALRAQLAAEMPRGTFETWVRPARLSDYSPESATITIQVATQVACDWLQSRLMSRLVRFLGGSIGQSVTIKFMVAEESGD